MRLCARPVMFATGAKVAPFSIAGTCFWIGYRRNIFVITARHVIRDWPPSKVLFYPPDGGGRPLSLLKSWNVVDTTLDNPSRPDLTLFHADYSDIPRPARKNARILMFDRPGIARWFEDRHCSSFFLCGYPHTMNEADYSASRALTAQVFLEGRYLAPSTENGVHQLTVANPLGIDFNGLSGAPVFSLRHEIAAPAVPKFCGLAIRGSASSAIIHFLEATPVFLALDEAVADILHPGRPRRR